MLRSKQYPCSMQVAFFGYVTFNMDEIQGDVLSNFPLNLIAQVTRFGECSSVDVAWPKSIPLGTDLLYRVCCVGCCEFPSHDLPLSWQHQLTLLLQGRPVDPQGMPRPQHPLSTTPSGIHGPPRNGADSSQAIQPHHSRHHMLHPHHCHPHTSEYETVW